MKTYLWYGINTDGIKINGNINAENADTAATILRQQNITPLKIRVQLNEAISFKRKKIIPKKIIDFCHQLQTLEAAGVPLLTSFDMLIQSCKDYNLRNILINIRQDLEKGATLSKAFRNKSSHFDELFCQLIHIGEESGTLETMLTQIVNYKENNAELKRKVKKALLYPCVILTTAVLVTAIMLIFVIPQFTELYHSFNAQLPLYTQMVISAANFTKSWSLPILAMCTATLSAIIFSYHKVTQFTFFVDKTVLHMPMIGKILEKSIIARITRVWAITFNAGLPMLDILKLITTISNNLAYQQALHEIYLQVENGQSVTTTFASQKIFPPHIVQMLNIGEESGKLDKMLEKIADHYLTEINFFVDNLSTLLEPMIMVILGIVIGGLIIGMYLPIFKLGNIL